MAFRAPVGVAFAGDGRMVGCRRVELSVGKSAHVKADDALGEVLGLELGDEFANAGLDGRAPDG